MNTTEIATALQKNLKTKKYFRGVFALDKIPKYIKKPATLIVNTDKSNQPGTHWIAIYCPLGKRCAEFFDSYGQKPTHTEFLNFLKRCSTTSCTIFNKKQLQGFESSVCGQYCCVYLWYRSYSKQTSMASFLKLFSKYNLTKNDQKIVQWFRKIFVIKKKNNKYRRQRDEKTLN